MTIKSGDIEVILNEPLFSGNSVWYPGYAETKSFQVKNRGGGTKQVQIEALSENETKNLSQGLNLEVRNDISCVYGCSEAKTLRNFFDTGSVNVGEVPADDSGKVFTMAVVMPTAAEDKYQGGRASFDLRIGFEGDAESTVTVQGDSGTPISTSTPTLTPTPISGLAPAGDEGEILGEEVTPMVTGGVVMGEAAGRDSAIQGQNWWLNWWWLVLLLILTAILFWRRDRL